MDRIIFGDNQFFAVNHMSDEKARAQALRFKDTKAIIKVLDYVYEIGIRTFMCTTHEKIWDICDHIRANENRYEGFKIYPCMPYAHKYNNAVAELGMIGALKKMMPKNVVGTMARSGLAIVKQDYTEIMKLLVDAEMKMFRGIPTDTVFLQNVVTDMLLGMGMTEFFVAFADYVRKKYNATPGFITMNFPMLAEKLNALSLEDTVVCSSINKIGFRMPGGVRDYESAVMNFKGKVIAMQALAAGAIAPEPAMKYICELRGVDSVLFGASSNAHIKQTKDLIEAYS